MAASTPPTCVSLSPPLAPGVLCSPRARPSPSGFSGRDHLEEVNFAPSSRFHPQGLLCPCQHSCQIERLYWGVLCKPDAPGQGHTLARTATPEVAMGTSLSGGPSAGPGKPQLCPRPFPELGAQLRSHGVTWAGPSRGHSVCFTGGETEASGLSNNAQLVQRNGARDPVCYSRPVQTVTPRIASFLHFTEQTWDLAGLLRKPPTLRPALFSGFLDWGVTAVPAEQVA